MKKSFFVFIALILILFGCSNPDDNLTELSFSCDLENSRFSNFTASNGLSLTGARYKSTVHSRSGKYSIMLADGRDKGLDVELNNVSIGDKIHAEVWRLKKENQNGYLALFIGEFFQFYSSTASRTEGDWELLEISVVVSKEFPGEGMGVFVQNMDDQPAYFDDLSVSLKRNGGFVLKSHPKLPKVTLEISKKGIDKIESKRIEAIEKGVLVKGSDDWAQVKAHWNDDEVLAKIRLKGDWVDHLYGQKFSFRVNVKNDKTLNTYSKFSLQNPVSRNYLDEWFVHQILINENILTTRYEFVDLWMNKKSKGMYAVEEHFTDNLLEAQNRKPGVILKYDEDEFWLSRFENKGQETKGVPWLAAAKIKTFSTKTVFEDEYKKQMFFRGRDLLYQFHFKTKPVEELIDIEKMAIFLALIDVTNGYHGLIWHNLRFYYNTDSDLLEPIAYDLFSEEIYVLESYDFLGQNYQENSLSYLIDQFDILFINPDFVGKYIYYLKKFTKPDFFINEKNRLDSLFVLYEAELKKEYTYYNFSFERYDERALKIRNSLDEFQKEISSRLNKKPEVKFLKVSKKADYLPITDVSLKANLIDSAGIFNLQLRSYYYKPLEIKAFVGNGDTIWLNESVTTPAYLIRSAPEILNIELSASPNILLYKTLEGDSIYSQRVVKYRAPFE